MAPYFGASNHVRIGDAGGDVRSVLDDDELNGDYPNISDEAVATVH